MTISEKLLQRLYVLAIGTVTTVATQRLLSALWTAATGERPPSPADPEATWRQIILWTAASSAGVAATRLISQRLTFRHLRVVAQRAAKDVAS